MILNIASDNVFKNKMVKNNRTFDTFTRLPVSIRVIFFALVLAPVGNLLFFTERNWGTLRESTAQEILIHLVNWFTIPGVLLLVASPIIAYGLFRLKKWAWISYLALFILVLPLSMAFFIEASTHKPDWITGLLFLLNIFYFVTAYRLVRKKVRLPYLASFPRDFRLSDRVPLQLAVQIETLKNESSTIEQEKTKIEGTTIDLSQNGIGIRVPKDSDGNTEFQPGNHCTLRIGGLSEMIEFQICRVIQSENETLLGLKYVFANKAQRDRLQNFISARYEPRYKVQLPASWAKTVDALTPTEPASNNANTGQTLNLSRRGSFIETEADLPAERERITMQFAFKLWGKQYTIQKPAIVIWQNNTNNNSNKTSEKPKGFGVTFSSPPLQWKRNRLFYFFYYYLYVVRQEPVR